MAEYICIAVRRIVVARGTHYPTSRVLAYLEAALLPRLRVSTSYQTSLPPSAAAHSPTSSSFFSSFASPCCIYPLSFALKLKPGASNLIDQEITKNNSGIFSSNCPSFVLLSSFSFPFFFSFFLDYRNKEFSEGENVV